MITITSDTCDGCGLCSKICPRRVPVLVEDGDQKRVKIHAEREGLCLDCGQCVALCRSGSIQAEGLDPDGYLPLSPHQISLEQMMSLLRQRRSVRRYKDREIPQQVLDQVVEAAAAAPTISGAGAIGVTVITGEEKLTTFSGFGYAMYGKLSGLLNNPIGRFMVKRRAGARTFGKLNSFLMPAMRWYIRWHEEGKGDEIRRDAPAVMLFHCPVDEPAGDETCLLSAFHAVLAAETLGLGTCINGMIPPVCNKSPEARAFLELPEGHEVFASLTLGYPRYRFKKTIPRKLTGVKFIS